MRTVNSADAHARNEAHEVERPGNFWDQRGRIWPPRATRTLPLVRAVYSYSRTRGWLVNSRSYIQPRRCPDFFLFWFTSRTARVYRGHWTKRASNLLALCNALVSPCTPVAGRKSSMFNGKAWKSFGGRNCFHDPLDDLLRLHLLGKWTIWSLRTFGFVLGSGS